MKIMRMSSLPISLPDLEAYKAEFTRRFDEAKTKHGQDMLSLQQELMEIDKELDGKFPLISEIDMPKSKRAWSQLIANFTAPIMIAASSENPKQLVLVVMDERIV